MTRSSLPCLQLTREVPPGYGGVERQVHILADTLASPVFILRSPSSIKDPLPVFYDRIYLPTILLGRIFLPLPSLALVRLLFSSAPLLAHLPCPTILALVALARLLRPRRQVLIYWHAFLQPSPDLKGFFERLYQSLALIIARLSSVITTSPTLRKSLLRRGCPQQAVKVLPCALSQQAEDSLKRLRSSSFQIRRKGRILFIGRLDSYKRVDWLVQSIANISQISELHVIGTGPDRPALEELVARMFESPRRVVFHGQVSENEKYRLLSLCDLLVLPSNRCNEAFGIVQLEAMAAGLPSIAFALPDSGMHWVSALPSLKWSGSSKDLHAILQLIFTDPKLLAQLSLEAANRYDRIFSRHNFIRLLRSIQHSSWL